jgi:hypothetical protein
MTLKPILFALAIVAITLSSCKKYDYGPLISFKSKKERIANTWKVGKAIRNGNDVTNDYSGYTLTTTADGDAKLVATYVTSFGAFSGNTDGTWIFESKKELINFDYENDDFDQVYKIMRLKDDELWMRAIGGEDELHLLPK